MTTSTHFDFSHEDLQFYYRIRHAEILYVDPIHLDFCVKICNNTFFKKLLLSIETYILVHVDLLYVDTIYFSKNYY